MKTKNILLVCFFLGTAMVTGQERFLTKDGYASFFSSTPIEDIKADNNQVLSIIDTETGTIAIAILMKSFMFEKSLMQEHFNENYAESDTYPKATFKGSISGFEALDKDVTKTKIEGDITIHGVTQTIEVSAKIIKTEDSIFITGSFPIKINDFGIKIPSVVVNNISETVEVKFDLDHKPYNK